MFCPNCGTKNNEDAGFCVNCGTSLVVEIVSDSKEQSQESADSMIPVTPVDSVTSVDSTTSQIPATPVEPVSPVYRPRKPLPKKVIGIIAVIAVIVVALIVFIVVGKKSENYEALATKYFIAEQTCKWDTVFDSIDIPDGEFLTKELLSKAQANTSAQVISNYSVSKQNDIYKNILSKDKELADGEISKDVYIEYRIKGESSNTTDTIGVIKLQEKNLLFFDKYKISPDNLVKSNFTIIVAKGAKVNIDGIEVSSKYLKESTSSKASSYSVAKDTYVIDYLFEGDYTIKVTQENMQDYEEEVTIDMDDDSYTYTDAKIDSTVSDKLASTGQDTMKTIYDAVVARKDFSTISSLFVNDTKIQSEAKSTYAYFMDEQITAAGIGLKKVSWTSIKGTVSQDSVGSDGVPSVTITVKGAYSATLTSTYSTTPTDRTGTITSYFYYEYVNGAWSLYDMDLSEIY